MDTKILRVNAGKSLVIALISLFAFCMTSQYSFAVSDVSATEQSAPQTNNTMKEVFKESKKSVSSNEDLMHIAMIIFIIGLVVFALFLAIRTKEPKEDATGNIKRKIATSHGHHHHGHHHPRR